MFSLFKKDQDQVLFDAVDAGDFLRVMKALSKGASPNATRVVPLVDLASRDGRESILCASLRKISNNPTREIIPALKRAGATLRQGEAELLERAGLSVL